MHRLTECLPWLLTSSLLIAFCASSPQRILNRLIEEDGGYLNLSHIESVVLPPNGEPAYVLLYATGVHASRVQVVAFRQGKPTILFEGGSNTPNTAFVRVCGIPTIVLERSSYEPDYVTGKRTQKLYPWNGTTFAYARADNCLL